MKKETNYVVLSDAFMQRLEGSDAVPAAGFSTSAVGTGSTRKRSLVKRRPGKLTARLVNLSADEVRSRKAAGEMNRLVYPVVHYFPQYVDFGGNLKEKPAKAVSGGPVFVTSALSPSSASGNITVEVVSKTTRKALAGIPIYCFNTPTHEDGEIYVTDKQGTVTVPLATAKLYELCAFPDHSYWSKVKRNVKRGTTVRFELENYAPNYDALALVTKGTAVKSGRGASVRVAVIDTGVGPHKDVKVSGGQKVLIGVNEPGRGNEDSGVHGTHVAGIIAGNSSKGMKGIAPEAELYSYRIFPHGQQSAPNANLAAAIMQAVADDCHIINLSLGAPKHDALVKKALDRAEAEGVLVIAAAGNNGLGKVSFPASVASVVSVSAVGCTTTYPKDSAHAYQATTPSGTVKSHYIAKFTNYGSNLVCTSSGVAVISTVPGNKFLAMDGTSMAAPMVSAVAACLLSAPANAHILQMPSDRRRSQAMRKLLYTSCSSLGFAADKQGKRGLPS